MTERGFGSLLPPNACLWTRRSNRPRFPLHQEHVWSRKCFPEPALTCDFCTKLLLKSKVMTVVCQGKFKAEIRIHARTDVSGSTPHDYGNKREMASLLVSAALLRTMSLGTTHTVMSNAGRVEAGYLRGRELVSQ
eukprot:5758247-Amphidinium_carterae.1